jgi:hypothetical protein
MYSAPHKIEHTLLIERLIKEDNGFHTPYALVCIVFYLS